MPQEKKPMAVKVSWTYQVSTPRELLFDGDGPSRNHWNKDTIEEAREMASKLKDSEIVLIEYIAVEGFSGTLSRITQVAK